MTLAVSGFTRLGTESCVSGGETNTMAVYRCDYFAEKLKLAAGESALDVEFVLVPAGRFRMGGTRYQSEQPRHLVEIARPFLMARVPVTQRVWLAITGSNPSIFPGDHRPVDSVSWHECREWCARLGDGLRLPTESEWEYCCRAGTRSEYFFGDDADQLRDHAWFSGNSGGQTHASERGLTAHMNAFGLFDMSGNIWECCEDDHVEYQRGAGSPDGQVAVRETPGRAPWRVSRGGSFWYEAGGCRSAFRVNWFRPLWRLWFLGFRPARSL